MNKRIVTKLSYDIVGAAIKVHKTLGPGLLESIYEKCLKHELTESGFYVQQQLKVPVYYEELTIETDFKLDLLVEDLIIVELKAVEKILPVHEAQLLSYMKLLENPKD